MPFQKLPFPVKNQKNHTGSNGSHQGIYRICKHIRWNNPQHNIPDHTSAYSCNYPQFSHTENVHIPFYTYHCPGSSKSNRSSHAEFNRVYYPWPKTFMFGIDVTF